MYILNLEHFLKENYDFAVDNIFMYYCRIDWQYFIEYDTHLAFIFIYFSYIILLIISH